LQLFFGSLLLLFLLLVLLLLFCTTAAIFTFTIASTFAVVAAFHHLVPTAL
jgi:hypothetical protein